MSAKLLLCSPYLSVANAIGFGTHMFQVNMIDRKHTAGLCSAFGWLIQ